MKKILLSSLIAVMAVSAANAKIASTDYADAVAEAAQTAATNAAAADATTKADAAEAAANSYTDGQIDTLTKGAIKSNADAIAGIKEDMKTVASSDTVTNIQNTLNKLDGADTTEGSVRQLIKAANDAQDTTLKAYADQAEADAITTAGNNATTAISNALKDYSTTNTIASTYAPISTTYTKDEVNSLVNVKANSADVYTKAEINTELGATGTTGKAIVAAQDTADEAVAAAAAAQAKADAAVVANTAITAGTGTKITYDAKGLVTSSTNLAEGDIPTLSIAKIDGLQSALDAKQATLTIDTELKADSTNAVENKAIATAINTINTSAVMTSGINSTKVGQIETNATNIGTNTAAINAIKTAEAGDFGTDEAYVLTATRDNNGVLQYKWEEIDRSL